MIWKKETHQSAKVQSFDRSHEISPNWLFDSLILLKVSNISAKLKIWDFSPTTLRSDAKFNEKLICLTVCFCTRTRFRVNSHSIVA